MGKIHHEKMVLKGKGKNDLLPLLALFVAVILIVAMGIYFFYSGKGEDDHDHILEPTEGWLDTYSPVNSVGTSDNDWWTTYPNQNPDRGNIVSHPSWIEERLKDGPILVFAHSDNCMPCIQQQESVDGIMKNHGDEIFLFDLLSGVDERASEIFKIYDPNGSPNYIPLTILITIVEDGFGNERIGWHGIEGATGGEWLTNYVKDAISYHYLNVDDWS